MVKKPKLKPFIGTWDFSNGLAISKDTKLFSRPKRHVFMCVQVNTAVVGAHSRWDYAYLKDEKMRKKTPSSEGMWEGAMQFAIVHHVYVIMEHDNDQLFVLFPFQNSETHLRPIAILHEKCRLSRWIRKAFSEFGEKL